MDRKVFRLQQLPDDADEHAVVGMLSTTLGVDRSTIRVFSLALSIHPLRPSKVATLMFNNAVQLQSILEDGRRSNLTKPKGNDEEWIIEVDGLHHPLIMDTHFRGLTPMHDPASHMADCVAISGLASHPLGSWQPKGQSKRFMWIRDSLPRSLPNVRPILYGYDTTLLKSNSNQSILDLAAGLVSQLRAHGLISPTSKPLAFLAHSLGGLVLKQAFLSLANRVDHQTIKGAIFFGVPNFGMKHSHFLAAVGGQPNARLVADLAPESTYLRLLDEQFTGVSYLQNTSLFWCYETQTSHILVQNPNGQWSQTGPREVLVTQESATRGLYRDTLNSDIIFPINEDHSSMVKFSESDHVYVVIAHRLSKILFPGGEMPVRLNEGEPKIDMDTSKLAVHPHISGPVKDLTREAYEGENYDIISNSLRASERDHRLEEIEERFKNTFDWIYDLEEIGFSNWLKEGTGLFWINGKPGSGKSTLMKSIFKDKRTFELLHDWTSDDTYTRAAFFFHYRGTPMQKSFEGLLRSILSQIISERRELCKFLLSMFKHRSLTPEHWTLPILQKALHIILAQDEEPLHLCLFLDAIDEYDGRKESICQFLQDLGRIPRTKSKLVKVCFSSRPWDVFHRYFQDNPKFSIQDYTKTDINDYCLGSLAKQGLSPVLLERLIPRLVERSRGVFLWVKLVVNDFAKNPGITAMSEAELGRLLEPYPTELDSYYTDIIERIPFSHRWKTYAMLEIAVRAKYQINPRDFMHAVNCSESRTYQEAIQAIGGLHRQEMEHFVRWVSHESKKYCGGLVEVIHYYPDHYYIQVLHQTVEDFVMSTNFKQLVLGDKASITAENGCSFLAKYWLMRGETATNVFYTRDAEKTTGRSLKTFLNSLPTKLLGVSVPGNRSLEVASPLAYAAFNGLRLYIAESLVDKPDLLRDSSEKLLSCVAGASVFRLGEDIVQTAELILDRGFKLGQDPTAFGNVMLNMYDDENDLNIPINDYQDITVMSLHLRLAELLINRGQDPDADIVYVFNKETIILKALHVTPYPLAQLLLDKGASVNPLCSKKMTPLDHCCASNIYRGHSFTGIDDWTWFCRQMTMQDLYHMINLLIDRGGELRKIKKSPMSIRFMELEAEGWPTEKMRASLFPPLRKTIMSKLKDVLPLSKA